MARHAGKDAMKLSISQTVLTNLQILGAFLLLLALTILVYYQSLSYGFVFDDYPNIVNRFGIRHETFSDLFFAHSRWIVFWLNTVYYKMVGFEPFLYRAGNLIIHSLNGSLIFVLIASLLAGYQKNSSLRNAAYFIAFLTAGLFLLHPVQTQTVCSIIQGQLEGTALLAMLSVLLLYTAYARVTQLWPRIALVLALLIFSIFACGTKEIAIVLPFLLLLIDWFFIAQGNTASFRKRLWLPALIGIAMLACFCFVLKLSFFLKLLSLNLTPVNNAGNILTDQAEEVITPLHFLISQFKVILHYLLIFIWPSGLSVDYGWKLSESFWEIDSFFPFLILLFLSAFIVRTLYRDRIDLTAFCWLWFFICALPRTSILPSSELLADYKTYQASVGIYFLFSLVIVKVCFALSEKYAGQFTWSPVHPALAMTFITVLAGQGVMANQRTRVWSCKTKFWQDALRHAPDKARAYNNYATALMEENQYQEALPYLKKAIELDPGYADAWNNMGLTQGALGNAELALEGFQRALHLNPGHIDSYNNMATYYIGKKDYHTAEMLLKRLIAVKKHHGTALFQLGQIAFFKNNIQTAYEYFKKSCTQSDRNSAEGYSCWGMTSMMLKHYEDALCAYSAAYKLKPDDMELLGHLAYAQLYTKHYLEAETLFKFLASKLTNNPKPLLGLADVFVATERYQSALELYKDVESHAQQLPLILLRMAGCYYKLKDKEGMAHYLSKLLQHTLSPSLENNVRELLLAHKYGDDTALIWKWFT